MVAKKIATRIIPKLTAGCIHDLRKVPNLCYNLFPSRTNQVKSNQANIALQEVDRLWKNGELNEALQKVEEIEIKYPSCFKAVQFYRGKIAYQLLCGDSKTPSGKR